MGKKTIWEKKDLELYGDWILRKIGRYMNDNEPCSVIPKIYAGIITFINSAEKHYGATNRELRKMVYEYRTVGGETGDFIQDLDILYDKAEPYFSSVIEEFKKELREK